MMSYRQYKMMDLLMLSFLAVIIEFFGYYLVDKLSSPVYLSFALTIGIVALVRWGVVGGVVYLLAGIPLVFLKEQAFGVSLMYEVLANLGLSIPFIFMIKKNRDIFAKNKLYLFLISLASILSLSMIKGIVLVAVIGEVSAIVEFFAFSLLMITMNLGLLMILAFNKSQLIRDMDTYIKESQIVSELGE